MVNRKIAVLGFRAVGKTSLTTQFVSGTFANGRYDPTIENTYHKTVRFRRVHFATDVVDTAGMDEYSRLSRNASVGVHGYVMAFSLANRQSFVKIQQINEVRGEGGGGGGWWGRGGGITPLTLSLPH